MPPEPSPGNLNPADFYEVAKAAFKAGSFAEAEAFALQLPGTSRNLSFLGRIQAVNGQPEAAVRTLDKALEIEPGNLEALSVLAAIHWEQRDYGVTAEVCRRLLALQPDNAQIWNSLGLSLSYLNRLEESVSAFEQGLKVAPDAASIHHNLGIVLHKLDRLPEAISEYEKAVHLAPQIAQSWDNLGQLYSAMCDHRALDCFERGARVASPGPIRDLLQARAIFNGDGDLREAERLTKSALQERPDDSLAYSLLGVIQQQIGQFEEANDNLRKALELAPDEPGPYFDIVGTKKIREEDAELVNRIHALVHDPACKRSHSLLLSYALGKAYDDLGRYEEALEIYREAQKLRKDFLGIKFDREAHRAELEHVMRTYTPELLMERAGTASQSRLPVLIVGMPRSGTTLTERILSAHRQVAGAGELPFWQQRVRDLVHFDIRRESTERAAADYLEILRARWPDALRVTDKLPGNFWHIGPILLALPQAKIIHVKRHPVDNCLSLFMTPFTEPPPYVFEPEDLVFAYQTYERLMAHWRGILSPERFMEIEYREMVEKTESASKKLVAFCDLEWDEACLHPEENAQEIRTASLWQARQPVYNSSLERWRRYKPWLGAFAELLTPEERAQKSPI